MTGSERPVILEKLEKVGVHSDNAVAERRREPRFKVVLSVQIWGASAEGHEFSQQVLVSDISSRGALLLDFRQKLRCGDLIGLRCNRRTARYRVVWTDATDLAGVVRVALHRLESDDCPWPELLEG